MVVGIAEEKFALSAADAANAREQLSDPPQALVRFGTADADRGIDDNDVAFDETVVGLPKLDAGGEFVAERGVEKPAHVRAGQVGSVFGGFAVGTVGEKPEDFGGEGGGIVQHAAQLLGGTRGVAEDLVYGRGQGHHEDAVIVGVSAAEVGVGVGFDHNAPIAVFLMNGREGFRKDLKDSIGGVFEPAGGGDVAVGRDFGALGRLFIGTGFNESQIVGFSFRDAIDEHLDGVALSGAARTADK